MLTAFVSQPRSGYGYSSVGSATIARGVLGWMGPQAGRAPLVSTCLSTVGLSMEELSQAGSDSWDFPNWECGVTAGTNGSDGWDTVGTTGNDSWENGTTGKMEPATVFIDGAALPATGHGRQAPTGCPTGSERRCMPTGSLQLGHPAAGAAVALHANWRRAAKRCLAPLTGAAAPRPSLGTILQQKIQLTINRRFN